VTDWRILVVPCVEEGKGSGHLKRSFALVRGLRELGKDARVYLPGPGRARKGERTAAEVLAAFPGEVDSAAVFSDDPAALRWTFIVLDRFRTPASEYAYWASLAPVVGVDEGGRLRRSFDYLIDLLPATAAPGEPNEAEPGWLPLPAARRASFAPGYVAAEDGLRVLVSFGGEDAAGLSRAAAASLSGLPGARVDVVLGALAAERSRESGEASPWPPSCRVFGPVPDLKERLSDYDLVVTIFGLTALEAAHARVPVLLVSPTRLHERLSRAAGFISAGIGRRAASRLGSFLSDPAVLGRIAAATEAAAPAPASRSLADRIASISFPSGVSCPLCGSRPGPDSPVLGRFPDRSYRRCADCGMLFLTRVCPPPIVYERVYFFEDYQRQYGKTYLEDFPNLEKAGSVRARRVREVLGPGAPPAPAILDIGCAYGPFLSAARGLGFQPFGLDPAADAVRHVRDVLGIPAAEGFFPDLDPASAFGRDRFDAVTLWYVIEHFPRLAPVLEAVSRLLPVGGAFAFSTPSGGGISARARFPDFLERSPADHYSIWEPRRTARLLARFGFRLEKIAVTGHHPERFPGLSRVPPSDPRFRLAGEASRRFGLGDTFEVYAVKERSLP